MGHLRGISGESSHHSMSFIDAKGDNAVIKACFSLPHPFTSLTSCYGKTGPHCDSRNTSIQSLPQWRLATSRADRQPNSSPGRYQLLFKGSPVLVISICRETKLMKAPTSFSSANSAAELIYPSTFYLVSFSLLILIEEHFRFCLYLWNSFESQIFLIFLRKTWNTALLKVKILTFYCCCDTTAHYCWVIFQIIGVVKSSTRLLSKTSCFVRISWELRHSMQTSRSVVWPWGSRQARTKRLCMYRCVFACV